DPNNPNRVELVQVDPNNPNTILARLNVTSVAPDGSFGVLQPFTPDSAHKLIPDGDYFLRARVVDVAGNATLSPVLKVTVDTTPPQTIPSLSLNPADDTGIVGDNITVARRPHFIGSYNANLDGPRQTIEIVNAANPTVALASIQAATNGTF